MPLGTKIAVHVRQDLQYACCARALAPLRVTVKASCSLQEKSSYLREVEGLVKDYEALAAEKEALEQAAAQQEGLHREARQLAEQAQQVSCFQVIEAGLLQCGHGDLGPEVDHNWAAQSIAPAITKRYLSFGAEGTLHTALLACSG